MLWLKLLHLKFFSQTPSTVRTIPEPHQQNIMSSSKQEILVLQSERHWTVRTPFLPRPSLKFGRAKIFIWRCFLCLDWASIKIVIFEEIFHIDQKLELYTAVDIPFQTDFDVVDVVKVAERWESRLIDWQHSWRDHHNKGSLCQGTRRTITKEPHRGDAETDRGCRASFRGAGYIYDLQKLNYQFCEWL